MSVPLIMTISWLGHIAPQEYFCFYPQPNTFFFISFVENVVCVGRNFIICPGISVMIWTIYIHFSLHIPASLSCGGIYRTVFFYGNYDEISKVFCLIERKNNNFHFEPVQHLKIFKCSKCSKCFKCSTGLECFKTLVSVKHLQVFNS